MQRRQWPPLSFKQFNFFIYYNAGSGNHFGNSGSYLCTQGPHQVAPRRMHVLKPLCLIKICGSKRHIQKTTDAIKTPSRSLLLKTPTLNNKVITVLLCVWPKMQLKTIIITHSRKRKSPQPQQLGLSSSPSASLTSMFNVWVMTNAHYIALGTTHP